jgi:DNA-binding MarR family transcriptional regulator
MIREGCQKRGFFLMLRRGGIRAGGRRVGRVARVRPDERQAHRTILSGTACDADPPRHARVLAPFTLAVVAAVEDCRVHDIVRGLSITVRGASKTVDRLERNGLVIRRPHTSDRRSSVISLTRTGATTHAKAQRLIAAELGARIGGVLPDRTLDQLHRAIAKLRAALAR